MKNARRKKKPKPPPKKVVANTNNNKNNGVVESEEEEQETKRIILEALVVAFSLSSMEEAAAAYGAAGGDPDKASEILRKGLAESAADEPFFFSSSSASSTSGASTGVSSGLDLASTSGSSDGFLDMACFKGGGGKQQKKKVVAAAGTVSTVLGKEYVRRNPAAATSKGFRNGFVDKEDAEQFLCSMLGDDCELNLAVVRDVLCQCGYNVEKAMDVLLDLASSTSDQSGNATHPDYRVDNPVDMRSLIDHNGAFVDRRSECTSLSSEGDFSDNFWSLGSFGRNYAEVLSSSKASSVISPECTKSDLPQKVLESLFNIPKSSEHNNGAMDWRNVAKKLQTLGPGFDVCPNVAESQKRTYTEGDEYNVFREDAKQHWGSMKSYFQRAATAYTRGDRAYAAYLSDQGQEQTKLAQKADTKASHDIFVARNKGIENVITLDFHGQHVKPAMRMLKLHLLFGSYVPSVQTLRVITGCGSHGVGKSKLKQSIIKLLNKETIEWSEENQGTVLIKLDGWKEFSFLDTDSDSDSN